MTDKKTNSETTKTVKIGKQTLPYNKTGGLFVPKLEQTIINNIDELESLALAVNSNLPILLIGETGTGKTSLVRHLARLTNNNFRRLNLSGGTTNDELKGHYTLEQGKGGGSVMRWTNGVLTDAMINGYWLVLDEINACLPEITFTLHSLLDDDGFIVLDEKEGEVIKPHKNFRIFATMNPSYDYAGTKELNKALLSRFSMVLQTSYQTAEVELEIIKSYNSKMTDAEGATMVKIADAIRQARTAGTTGFICSTRELINWAKLLKSMSLAKAFELAVLNKCDYISEKQTLEDIAQLYLGKITDKPIMSFADFDKELALKDKELAEVTERLTKATKDIDALNNSQMAKSAECYELEVKLNDATQNAGRLEKQLEELKAENVKLADRLLKSKDKAKN